MKQLLQEHYELEKKIYKYFGTTPNFLGISDHTDDFWDSDGHTVVWSEEKEHFCNEDLDPMYSAGVQYYHKGEDFTMLVLRCGTGDEETAIFDNSKRCNYLATF